MALISVAIRGYRGKVAALANQAMRDTAWFVWDRVHERSPVLTGRFRASWRCAVNKIDRTYEPVRKEHAGPEYRDALTSREFAMGLAIEGVSARGGHKIYITNSVPYASKIENGRSVRMAPNGVLKRTLAEARARGLRGIGKAVNIAGT